MLLAIGAAQLDERTTFGSSTHSIIKRRASEGTKATMRSVLVVDDELEFTRTLGLALEAAGYQVRTAGSGEAALIAAKQARPDLILLDLLMPGAGGLETIKILKSLPTYEDIPVVLMSGSHPMVKQKDYGWAKFLQKPFAHDDLLETIRSLIGKA